MKDTRYITKKNNKYYFQIRVPEALRSYFRGAKTHTVALGTGDLAIARTKRNTLLAEIDRLKASITGDSTAIEYRRRVAEWYTAAANEPEYTGCPWEAPVSSIEIAEIVYESPKASQTEKDAAYTFITGKVNPKYNYTLKEGLQDFNTAKKGKITNKTLAKADKAVEQFLLYIDHKDIPLDQIKRKQVIQFIRGCGKAGKTIKNYLSMLSGIWKNAIDLEEVHGNNPFDRHIISTKDTQNYQRFSPPELQAIMEEVSTWKGKDTARYLIPRIGLFTGCRLDEICRLRVEDVITDQTTRIIYIQILEGKTVNAKRRIPLHPSILEEVLEAKVAAEEQRSEWLFPTLTVRQSDGSRSDAFSKWFGRLKKQHTKDGRAKCFHSFRVHMATALEQGGIPEETAVWLLGHTRNLSLSYGLYSKGPSLEQLKAAVDGANHSIPVRSK